MLESIRRQTYGSYELVLVDDGSTDMSPSIMEAHAMVDGRIRILQNEEQLGIVRALNLGLEACEGKYVARMDADDIAVSDRLEKQVAFMEAHPEIAALGAAVTYITEDGQPMDFVRRSDVSKSLLRRNPLLHPTVIMRRGILEQHQLSYRPQFQYAEDYYLWLELSKVSTISAIDDVVLYYRLSDSALRVQKLKPMIRATLRVKLKGWIDLGITPSLTDLLVLLSEAILLLVPTKLVWNIYLRFTFRSRSSLHKAS